VLGLRTVTFCTENEGTPKGAKSGLERGIETEKSAAIAKEIAKSGVERTKNVRYVILRIKVDLIRASLG
jgi:hypothetical protein